jgi:hypothetical protein
MEVRVSWMIAGYTECWAKAQRYVRREESPDTTLRMEMLG